MEDVTLENLHSLSSSDETSLWPHNNQSINNASNSGEFINDDDLVALKCNAISFGDVYINEKKQLLFTMKNRSQSDAFRFEWPAHVPTTTTTSQSSSQPLAAQSMSSTTAEMVTAAAASTVSAVQFSPCIGHLHAGCAKDITVTFKSTEPRQLRNELVHCLLNKIVFEQSVNEVKDWDDRMTTVKWVNEVVGGQSNPTAAIAANARDSIPGPLSKTDKKATATAAAAAAAAAAAVEESIEYGNPRFSTDDGIVPAKQIVRKKVIEIEPEPRHTRSDESVQPIELFVSANCDFCRYRCRTNVIRFRDTLMFQTRVYE